MFDEYAWPGIEDTYSLLESKSDMFMKSFDRMYSYKDKIDPQFSRTEVMKKLESLARPKARKVKREIFVDPNGKVMDVGMWTMWGFRELPFHRRFELMIYHETSTNRVCVMSPYDMAVYLKEYDIAEKLARKNYGPFIGIIYYGHHDPNASNVINWEGENVLPLSIALLDPKIPSNILRYIMDHCYALTWESVMTSRLSAQIPVEHIINWYDTILTTDEKRGLFIKSELLIDEYTVPKLSKLWEIMQALAKRFQTDSNQMNLLLNLIFDYSGALLYLDEKVARNYIKYKKNIAELCKDNPKLLETWVYTTANEIARLSEIADGDSKDSIDEMIHSCSACISKYNMKGMDMKFFTKTYGYNCDTRDQYLSRNNFPSPTVTRLRIYIKLINRKVHLKYTNAVLDEINNVLKQVRLYWKYNQDESIQNAVLPFPIQEDDMLNSRLKHNDVDLMECIEQIEGNPYKTKGGAKRYNNMIENMVYLDSMDLWDLATKKDIIVKDAINHAIEYAIETKNMKCVPLLIAKQSVLC